MNLAFLVSGLAWGQTADVSTPSVSLTMGDFVELALAQGLSGRQVRFQLESDAYAKSVVLRQTVGPVLTANITGNEDQSRNNGTLTKTQAGQDNLTMNQPFVTGTNLALSGTYNTSLMRSPTSIQQSFLRPGWSAVLTQPVFLFVKNPVLRARQRAGLAYDSAKDSYRANLLGVKTQARSLYYDVLLKRESLGVEKRKLDSSRALLQITEALVGAGKLPGVEALRSRVRMEGDRRQYESADNEVKKAEQTAKDFVNMPLDRPVEFSSVLSYRPFGPSLESLTRYALSNRPDLLRLERAKRLARLDLDQAREPARPTFSLTGAYNSNETYLTLNSVPGNTLIRDWNVGGALSWQFFDFFVTRDQTRKARIAAELADLDYERTLRSTALEVKNAYMDVKTAELQLLDFKSVRDSARNNVEVLRVQFRNGRGKLIDVFDAENEARGVELQYLNLLVNYYLTQDRLAQLLGAELDKL